MSAPHNLPADVLSAQQLANYRDIAAKEWTAGQRAQTRTVLRELIRDTKATDPLEAASARLKDLEEAEGSVTVRERALWYGAALDIQSEGREGREEVATQDRPAADPTKKGKGRKGKKKDGKARHRPAKASASWVKALGKDVLVLDVRGSETAFDEHALLEQLRAGAGPIGPHLGKAPRSGWCQIRDLLDVTFPELPRVLPESDVLLFGFRLDEKKGLPTARLRAEAKATARARASSDGLVAPTKEEVDAVYDELAERWYAGATPTSTVVPVTVHLDEFRVLVHTKSAKLRDMVRAALGGTKASERPALWTELERRDLAATDLRRENGIAESGKADLGRDLLLWICARTAGGTGVLDLGDGSGERLEFWIDDRVKLIRQVPDEKTLKVELGRAPTEGGSLFAALADGAQPTSMRITLRAKEREFHATIEGGQAVALGLPCLVKPSTEAEITDALVERLLLYAEADELVMRLTEAFLADRASGWGQRMNGLRRALGIEIAQRYAWDEATKQGFLFAHMLPGAQTTIAEALGTATTQARGRASRGRASV